MRIEIPTIRLFVQRAGVPSYSQPVSVAGPAVTRACHSEPSWGRTTQLASGVFVFTGAPSAGLAVHAVTSVSPGAEAAPRRRVRTAPSACTRRSNHRYTTGVV